jgi:hypothetical protein
LYAQCFRCLWIVYSWLPLLVCPMFPMSLDCPFLITPTCVPNVSDVSGLSILDYPYLCAQCLWIVHSWLPLHVCPMFPMSLDCPFLITPTCVSNVSDVSGLSILDPYSNVYLKVMVNSNNHLSSQTIEHTNTTTFGVNTRRSIKFYCL